MEEKLQDCVQHINYSSRIHHKIWPSAMVTSRQESHCQRTLLKVAALPEAQFSVGAQGKLLEHLQGWGLGVQVLLSLQVPATASSQLKL